MSDKYETRPLADAELPAWDALVKESDQGTVFQESFWLKAAPLPCEILGCFDSGGALLGGIPVCSRRVMGFKVTRPPIFAPYQGVIFKRDDEAKYVRKLSREKEVCEALAKEIKRRSHFAYIDLSPEVLDIQPFIWNGYTGHVRYTYRLDISDMDKAWSGMDPTQRNNIKRAEKDGITVDTGDDLQTVFGLVEKTFERQKMRVSFREAAFRYEAAAKAQDRSRCFVARNRDGQPIASLYIAWDARRSYHLLAGYDPELMHRGASALTIWRSLEYTRNELGVKEFDFEGSMQRQIEVAFRKFGGRLTPHYAVIWRAWFLEPAWFVHGLRNPTYR